MAASAASWLANTLDYKFADPALLQQALTHRSCPGANNERLEFLGDAVLDVVVSDVIFRVHANAAEGDLSRLRAALVNDSALAELASDLGLGEHLILGGGERKMGGHRRDSILADAIEAIFGAVYLDAGFDAARTVIERAFAERFENLPSLDKLRDPKTRLQEWLQARGADLPDYTLVNTSGKAHKQKFEVTCSIHDGEFLSNGFGTTRRGAEQEAAGNMLAMLRDSNVGES